MAAIQNSIFFWLALMGLLAFLAVLPTLIALARGVDDIGIIMLFNAICCTTVFGWPIALILAIKWPSPHRTLRRPHVPRVTRHHTRGPYA